MPTSSKSHVIIGNSAAAIGAVEGIRKAGNTEPITVISDEPHLAYSRPLISELLAGQVSSERMYYRPADFYKKHQVETCLGIRAVKIDPKKQVVKLEDGRNIPYQNLLIATGSSPIIPPMEGVGLAGVFTFLRWQEASALLETVGRARRAVVIGAGLIGLKAAEALRHNGLEVTVIELAPRILPMAADAMASAIIESHMRTEGIRITTGTSVTKIQGDAGKVKSVVLSTGETIPCDIVIIAVGVRPNIELAKEAAIETRRGILVDAHMQTSTPSIYAAGDVAEGYDLIMGENRLLPLWPVAYRQGVIAGANMAGQDKEYDGLFAMNSMQLFDLPLISVGRLEAPDEPGYEVLTRMDGNVYRKIILKDDVVVGAVFLTAVDRVGIFTGLIKDRTPVTAFKDELLREDFGLLSLPKEWRKQKLIPEGSKYSQRI